MGDKRGGLLQIGGEREKTHYKIQYTYLPVAFFCPAFVFRITLVLSNTEVLYREATNKNGTDRLPAVALCFWAEAEMMSGMTPNMTESCRGCSWLCGIASVAVSQRRLDREFLDHDIWEINAMCF